MQPRVPEQRLRALLGVLSVGVASRDVAADSSDSRVGVVIYAVRVDVVAGFYQAVLGLEEVERAEGYAVLSDGVRDVSVVAVPPAIAQALVISQPPEIREDVSLKPTFAVASLDLVAELASEHGGGIKPGAEVWTFRGLRHRDCFDPEGNVIQFVAPDR